MPPPTTTTTTFDILFAAAKAVYHNAYAPYSRFPVGAALLGDDGNVYIGSNVENASYPAGVCAEGGAISAMVAAGCRRITALAVVSGQPGDGSLGTPCGICRQRIREFADPHTPVHVCGPEGLRRTLRLDELLPHAFDADSLAAGRAPAIGHANA